MKPEEPAPARNAHQVSRAPSISAVKASACCWRGMENDPGLHGMVFLE